MSLIFYMLVHPYNVGLRGATAVSRFACLPGSSIETGPGEPGERVCCRRGRVYYLIHICLFSFSMYDFLCCDVEMYYYYACAYCYFDIGSFLLCVYVLITSDYAARRL